MKTFGMPNIVAHVEVIEANATGQAGRDLAPFGSHEK
jgi:hypothetical protein